MGRLFSYSVEILGVLGFTLVLGFRISYRDYFYFIDFRGGEGGVVVFVRVLVRCLCCCFVGGCWLSCYGCLVVVVGGVLGFFLFLGVFCRVKVK